MRSPPLKWFLHAVLALAALVVVAAMGLAFLLPRYLERHLIPELSARLALAPDPVRVRRIGLWGSDLGPVRLSRNGRSVVSLAAVQIDYTPLSLLRGEVTGLTVAGLEITASLGSQGLSIAGVTLPPAAGSGTKGPAAPPLEEILPIALDHLRVVNAALRLAVEGSGRSFRIPFDLHLRTDRLADGLLEAQAAFSVLENPFTLAARVDQGANRAQVTLEAPALALETLAARLPRPRAHALEGRADIDLRVQASLDPLQLAGLSATARFSDTRLIAGDGWVGTLDGEPLTVTLAGQRLGEMVWTCGPLAMGGPLAMAVDQLRGELALSSTGWRLSGAAESRLPAQPLPGGLSLDADAALAWILKASGGGDSGGARFELQSDGGDLLKLGVAGGRGSIPPPEVVLRGRYRAGSLRVEGDLRSEAVRLQTDHGALELARVEVAAAAELGADDRPAVATLRGAVSDLTAEAPMGSLQLPTLAGHLTARAVSGQPWTLGGHLDLERGQVTALSGALQLAGLSLDLPLAWPAPAAGDPGRLAVAGIRWKGLEMGAVSGTVVQTGAELGIDLRHRNRSIPGLTAVVQGRLAAAAAEVRLLVPPHEIQTDMDLGRFSPAAAGFLGSGRIGGAAQWTLDRQGARGSGRFKLAGGRLRQAAGTLSLEGVDLNLRLDDLLRLKSAPRQRLQVARLALGELRADQLDVALQLEDDHTVFIEKADLNWCGGRINTSALRIDRRSADGGLTLYCDRLNLAELLEQLGAAEASGDGSVNGRIPVSWSGRALSFDNGFLYSTPGQAGTIKLSGTGALLAGLPPGSPQHTQLDIATEALKDYSYRWAKLHLASEDTLLLLKLQLDGKPNRALPFVYDTSLGQFRRVSGAGNADFKGISIDLNFRSPLNEIIAYKELLTPK